MKTLVIPNKNLNNIDESDGIIVGLKDFSCNLFEMNYDEIISFLKQTKKEVFIGINKNIHNNEIDELTDYLIKFSKLNIKGILYADTAILKINNDLNLNLNLIWSQEHLTTNYHTINYWIDLGANGAFISNDITLRESLEIRENVKNTLMIQVFGYVPIYVSKRHAVKNYFDNFKINGDISLNYLYKEDKKYPILDKKMGTEVYSNNILCAIDEYESYQKFDYIVLNFFNIDINYNKIITIFKNVNKNNLKEYIEYLQNNFSNLDKIFWHAETIYKVK